jgi:putative ABC transport system permease protein
MALVGVFTGILASITVGQFMTALLFAVKPADGPTIVAASFLLIVVATVACCIPARRAMRVDPMVALKYE